MTDRTDVYALGVMLFEMLTGRLPLAASDNGEQIAMHLFTPPPKMSEAAPSVPEPMSSLVDQLLLKDPTQRASMADIMRQLALLSARAPVLSPSVLKLGEPFADTAIADVALSKTLPHGEPLTPVSQHAAERISPERRSPWAAWAGGTGALVVALAGIWYGSSRDKSTQQLQLDFGGTVRSVDAPAGPPSPVRQFPPVVSAPLHPDMGLGGTMQTATPSLQPASAASPPSAPEPLRNKKRRTPNSGNRQPQAQDKMEYEP